MDSRCLCAVTILTASLMAGCHQLKSDLTDWRLSRQIAGYANDAWSEYGDVYEADIYYIDDFGDGFKAGYAQILAGGDICPPTLPPPRYWKAKFQTQEGHDQIDTWFSGHEAGVATAMQEGVGSVNKIPLSPFRRAQLAGGRSCPTCFPPAEAAPAHDYEEVPPLPPGDLTQYLEPPVLENSSAVVLPSSDQDVGLDAEPLPPTSANLRPVINADVQE
ncbi:MAG TPA: hypothetical protein VFG20_18250 [Planctomycetaceae bacterium]|nr:hypothetical protein [Planctomycetaceae bacterium]